MTALLLLVTIFALAVSAFCSGSETGFLSVRRERVLHIARAGGARAKIIFRAISDLGRTTTAILVGNNLANVTYSSCISALGARMFADSLIVDSILSVCAAIILLFIGEFLPKLLCSARPLRQLLRMAPAWSIFERIFVPVGSVVQCLIEWMMPRKGEKSRMTPEMVLKVLADRKEGVRLSSIERRLIERLMILRSKGEFITPESLISAID